MSIGQSEFRDVSAVTAGELLGGVDGVVPQLGAEKPLETASTVRGAKQEDISSLVQIELQAFSDVYGDDPSAETVTSVEDKFNKRVEVLGDWIRVLENPEDGVYGMMVLCPTSLDREDFIERDMTQNSFIEDAYDPDGKNVYVVNLAILPNGQKGKRFDLFADGIQKAIESGIEYAYFESRLPRLHRWVEEQTGVADISELQTSEIDRLAEEYWQTNDDKTGKPVDPLLRIYTDFGSVPLRLVKDAWREDLPSKTYGVLCEFEVPHPEDEQSQMVSALDTEQMSWWQRNKKKVATGTILGSVAVGIPHVAENWDTLWERGLHYGLAYGTFTALYSAGGIAKATSSVRRRFERAREVVPNESIDTATQEGAPISSALDHEAQESAVYRRENKYLIANGIGAVGMGGTALVAAIDLLPPQSWPVPAAIAAADIAASVWSRRTLLHKTAEAQSPQSETTT